MMTRRSWFFRAFAAVAVSIPLLSKSKPKVLPPEERKTFPYPQPKGTPSDATGVYEIVHVTHWPEGNLLHLKRLSDGYGRTWGPVKNYYPFVGEQVEVKSYYPQVDNIWTRGTLEI